MRPDPGHEVEAAVARCADHVRACARRYPRAWRQLDLFRSRRDELGGWPAWCFCPLSGAYAIVTGGDDRGMTPGAPASLDVGRLAALGAWRVGQGVYWIDDDVRGAVLDTPVDGAIPVDVLLALPEWCIYVALPGHAVEGRPVLGFFAHLEHDTHDGRTELRLEVDFGDEGPFESLVPEILHLRPGETLATGYDRMLAEMRRQVSARRPPSDTYLDAERQVRETASARLSPLLSVLLYLCSATAEYRAGGESRPSRPAHPRPARVKGGWRLFAPERATAWYVGERLGEAIRRAADGPDDDTPGPPREGRAGPRPHVRRAHWHLYWLGAKDPASPLRRPELRWLPPIPVALAEDTAEARMRHDRARPIRDLGAAVAEAARDLEPRGGADAEA